jgi:hypothetical protein
MEKDSEFLLSFLDNLIDAKKGNDKATAICSEYREQIQL